MSLKKLSYIFQATNEIKYLEDQAKELQENYEALKLERELLLAEKEKTFHGNFCSYYSFICNWFHMVFKLEWPDNVSQMFNCLMEPTSLPSRQLQFTTVGEFH